MAENGVQNGGSRRHHPLHDSWTFWYFENDQTKDYDERLKEIGSFSTVEGFWAYYNHLKPVFAIPFGCNVSLFKKGIRPMWEDVANKQGGQWIIKPSAETPEKSPEDLRQNLWKETCMALVGGVAFNGNNNICGATYNRRTSQKEKLVLWTADANAVQSNLAIGESWKEAVGARSIITYEKHDDTSGYKGRPKTKHSL